jgi:hypothetical protein
MLWLLGLTFGIAVLAILSVEKLDGKLPRREQPVISWD